MGLANRIEGTDPKVVVPFSGAMADGMRKSFELASTHPANAGLDLSSNNASLIAEQMEEMFTRDASILAGKGGHQVGGAQEASYILSPSALSVGIERIRESYIA